MGTYIFFAVSLILAVGLSVAGLALVRKTIALDTIRSYHEVSGPMLAIVGTLYAVVLGFIVVDALNSFQKARQLVEQEANALADVFHFAGGFPDDKRIAMQNLCLDYADSVLKEEWSDMEKGQSSKRASTDIQGLWDHVIKLVPKTEKEETIYSTMLQKLGDLGDFRRTRLVTARHVFDPIIWSVLITGGVLTIVFTYFFGLHSFKAQSIMTSMVTLILCLNMFLVAMFGYPFSGDVKVYPEAFMHDREVFENSLHNSGDERN